MKTKRTLNCLTMAALIFLVAGAFPLSAQDMVITGVVDGPLSGGIPKAVELCVLGDIPDLSIYGLGSANNGGGTDGEEFTFPAGAASAGSFIYIASEATGFASFFGFAPDHTSGAMAINGDDAIELFTSGAVSDVFGDINLDGSGQPWDYLDGWAYRNDGTGPDGSVFALANWFFSGINALDGETANGSAAVPFPIGAYSGCAPAAAVPDVLLSEIVVTPTGGEFVEIFNPTAAAVDLSDVYMTDATFAGGGTFYYNIVTGANAGGGAFSDFHARFPAGASITAGEFQTVAIAGSDAFFLEYGANPTYELFEDGAPDAVPDMREALPGSINGQGGLSNDGEIVILYTWDGASDLVADIDYAVWGDKAEAADKTGVAIDGPDADLLTTSYLADTAIALQDPVSAAGHGNGDSFQRIDFSEGAEVQAGGNGVSGSDETSEDLSNTWSQASATPGAGPPPPPASGWVINEINADPATGITGDANGDGTQDFSEDEFVEIYNNSGGDVDVSGWTLADAVGVRHVFPAGSVIVNGCSAVVFGGGTPTGEFGNGLVQTASSGAVGLNNGGDSVALNDGATDVATASYGSQGGNNQSLTLDPDVTGAAFVEHSSATGSGGALYSPGTMIDGTFFAGCPPPPAPWVINEIHADPATDITGDANDDGIRSSNDDEFLEVVNNTGVDVDVSGWTLADGFSMRHTFPMGSVIRNGCAAVVFGGGTPTGAFGNSLVQTASSGSVGLNNGGDSVTLNDGATDVAMALYGGEGGDNQSLTLDPDVTGALPYVKHTVAVGSGGTLFSPGSRIDGGQFSGCPVSAEIFEVQGLGLTSPLVDALVISEDNIVTALGTDGFFMQTPLARTDGDPDTSDGIFVFTGAAPTVAVGDQVDVLGQVAEFFNFTEFSFGTSVSIDSSGNSVPAPVVFDGATPSPDPLAPSCAIEFECYEGMLVSIASGAVSGSNQRFNPDPVAEVHIVADATRAFREPGVGFPGLGLPPIPTWDGNPEVFELDPDKLGLPNQIIPAGSSFSAVGVIGFEFGGYELWPTELAVNAAPLPVSVRPRATAEFTVGTLNLFRLFDDVDDPPGMNADGQPTDDVVVSPAEYLRRRDKLVSYILDVLGAPDILAVQEVEKLAVLADLAADIASVEPTVNYTAHLVEGNDIGGIDVGFLTRDGIRVDAVTQLAAAERLDFDDSLLHDRPPLLLEGACASEPVADDDDDSDSGSDSDSDSGGGEPVDPGESPIAVIAVHSRSLGGIEDPTGGERVRAKRLAQAQSIAQIVQDMQTSDPDVNLVVIGDFNAFEFTDGYVDVTGQMKGDFDPAMSLLSGPDLVDPDFTDQVLSLPEDERYSFIFGGSAQVLDHALTSAALAPYVRGFEYGRGNADAAVDLINDSTTPGLLPLRSSDHDGAVLYIAKDGDRDGVTDEVDVCPGTVIPEGVPTKSLGVNRWALVDGDGEFDTRLPGGGGGDSDSDSDSGGLEPLEFSIDDTAGCSCEQIIEALHLGGGHTKHGCSTGAMMTWVDLVNP